MNNTAMVVGAAVATDYHLIGASAGARYEIVFKTLTSSSTPRVTS